MENSKPANFVLTLTTLSLIFTLSQAQLSETFYNSTCPNALGIIRATIQQAVQREPRMAASLIRLHFHDCFVQGCDASILLDDTPTIQSEKSAGPNANSVRGYDVIEAAKSAVESICPLVVSCADILAVAARDAAVLSGGPSWAVKLGRRDSTIANLDAANSDLPGPFSTLDGLTTAFAKKGLNQREMVALSGAHSIGQAQCTFFQSRIDDVNASGIDPGFAARLNRTCTRGSTKMAPLDFATPNTLDNKYYQNLVGHKGLFQSDQVLFSTVGSNFTAALVSNYSAKPNLFSSDFANAMLKMSEIQLLLGTNGTIRRVCNVTS
ncbi:Peroxidase 5 [Striga hermonthica]|uniref:Peroxidase n=1 Tax=Striga hermonthica TaxID=68872 RepID=A0A9N7RR64_STRHE|nr:Peroxidase 5 [Striga hermonthica]